MRHAEALEAELDKSVERLGTEMGESDAELRGHLRYVLAASISGRVTGAILVGVGNVLATAGSVVGNVAS